MCYWHVTQKETKRFFLKPKLFVWYNQAHLGGDAWSSELARMQTLACCCWHHQVPISMSFYHLLLKDHIKGSYITFLSSIILFFRHPNILMNAILILSRSLHCPIFIPAYCSDFSSLSAWPRPCLSLTPPCTPSFPSSASASASTTCLSSCSASTTSSMSCHGRNLDVDN